MPNNPDVVIAGAGAAGCAAAYFLAREGARVTIVERDSIASHASGFAFGMLNPFYGAITPGPVPDLFVRSLELHHRLHTELKEATGINYFSPTPFISLALHPEEQRALTRHLSWQRGEALSMRWIDASEARSLEPRLSPRILGGLYFDNLAIVEAYRYTLALGQAAEKLGATIRHGTVTGLLHQGSRATGITLSSGQSLSAGAVVLATGPWAAEASRWLGFPLPVEPLKGQILRLEPPDGQPLHCALDWGRYYAATKPDGLVWAGTTMEHAGFDETPTPAARNDIMRSLVSVLPAFREARLVQQTACLRPLSADGLPIIGPVPGWQGVFVSTGAGPEGILLSAIMGRAVADLVLHGRASVDLTPFLPSRFGP